MRNLIVEPAARNVEPWTLDVLLADLCRRDPDRTVRPVLHVSRLEAMLADVLEMGVGSSFTQHRVPAATPRQ